ncbi:hypothetical protein TOC8171_54550 [Pseudomonas syringae]
MQPNGANPTGMLHHGSNLGLQHFAEGKNALRWLGEDRVPSQEAAVNSMQSYATLEGHL